MSSVFAVHFLYCIFIPLMPAQRRLCISQTVCCLLSQHGHWWNLTGVIPHAWSQQGALPFPCIQPER